VVDTFAERAGYSPLAVQRLHYAACASAKAFARFDNLRCITMDAEQHKTERAPLEDLTFHGSDDTTLGVELELQILERETGDLAPGALRILGGCEEERLEGVTAEFLMSMIEVKTGVCQNVSEVRSSLFPLIRRVKNIAASLGYDVAIGGTHPFGRASMSAIYPAQRYQRIQKHQGLTAYQEAVFGLHVHVGVPGGEQAVGVTNLLVEYLPHMLALAANSPFWQGIDTGYASARVRMFHPAAHAGVPPHFSDWQGVCEYCQVMYDAGVIEKTKDIYWDIRPRPHQGTIEFRIFDAPPTLSRLLALTALVRCLVIEALRTLEEQPEAGRGDRRHFWLAQENRWLATRYGLGARCVRHPGGARKSLLDDTAELIDRLRPVAEETGEWALLAELQRAPLELGADRQRHIYRQAGNWQAVIDDMKHRWAQELDEVPAALATEPAHAAK
jgi:carboxylate-amine ligase